MILLHDGGGNREATSPLSKRSSMTTAPRIPICHLGSADRRRVINRFCVLIEW